MHWFYILRLAVAGAASLALGGCVARVDEQRIEEPARPTAGARGEVTVERRGEDCRDVTVTAPMVRVVELRRSFPESSDAQSRNAALAVLLGAGAGLVGYDASSIACSRNDGGCSDKERTGIRTVEYGMIGLAAVPLALLAYNALRGRDGRAVEAAPPEVLPGPWHPCPAPVTSPAKPEAPVSIRP